MTAPLNLTDRDKLIKLLGMLGSDYIGERASAGALAHRLVKSAGLSWSDLISVPAASQRPTYEAPPRYRRAYPPSDPDDPSLPHWRQMALELAASTQATTWEVHFAHDLLDQDWDPTRRQFEVLARAWKAATTANAWM